MKRKDKFIHVRAENHLGKSKLVILRFYLKAKLSMKVNITIQICRKKNLPFSITCHLCSRSNLRRNLYLLE